MSARVTFDGLAEFRAQLRHLPEALKAEGAEIVLRRARVAEARAKAAYQKHRRSGHLADGVVLVVESTGAFGAAVVVKSTALHAVIFENGSQVRHNRRGAYRGSMPPGNVFVPIMVQERRAMYGELAEMMRRNGLEVLGV